MICPDLGGPPLGNVISYLCNIRCDQRPSPYIDFWVFLISSMPERQSHLPLPCLQLQDYTVWDILQTLAGCCKACHPGSPYLILEASPRPTRPSHLPLPCKCLWHWCRNIRGCIRLVYFAHLLEHCNTLYLNIILRFFCWSSCVYGFFMFIMSISFTRIPKYKQKSYLFVTHISSHLYSSFSQDQTGVYSLSFGFQFKYMFYLL